MTSPQPSPQFAQAQPSGPGVQDYKSVLGIGGQESPEQMNAEQMRRQQIQSVSVQIQGIGSQLDGIARQFPASAKPIAELKRNLTGVLVTIVGSSMSESQPSTGAMG